MEAKQENNTDQHLYRVSVVCDKRGWFEKVRELDVIKETPKSIITTDKRIGKDKLMIPDSLYIREHRAFRFHTFCHKENIEVAKTLLKQHILRMANEIRHEFWAVSQHMYNEELYQVGDDTPIDTTVNRIMNAVIFGFDMSHKNSSTSWDVVKKQIKQEINWLLEGRQ